MQKKAWRRTQESHIRHKCLIMLLGEQPSQPRVSAAICKPKARLHAGFGHGLALTAVQSTGV